MPKHSRRKRKRSYRLWWLDAAGKIRFQAWLDSAKKSHYHNSLDPNSPATNCASSHWSLLDLAATSQLDSAAKKIMMMMCVNVLLPHLLLLLLPPPPCRSPLAWTTHVILCGVAICVQHSRTSPIPICHNFPNATLSYSSQLRIRDSSWLFAVFFVFWTNRVIHCDCSSIYGDTVNTP